MSSIDENLLTAAKLLEQKRGDLDGHVDLHNHAGEVVTDRHRTALSFVESSLQERDDVDALAFEDTTLGRQVAGKFRADAASNSLDDGNATRLSHLVGVTESELQADALSLHARLNELIENNGAPAYILGAGNPETGKTNLMLLLIQLRSHVVEDLMVVSNAACELTDERVTSAHDLAVTLLKNRDRPKVVFIDESSTHFDARTYRREVATQWTPLAKRFAKIGVDFCGNVIHTGKDAHPELKRLSTLSYFKLEQKVVEFYAQWDSDAEMPTERLFGGPLEDLEAAGVEYSPNDSAPWSWNLELELFSEDLGWDALLNELHRNDSIENP